VTQQRSPNSLACCRLYALTVWPSRRCLSRRCRAGRGTDGRTQL